MDIDGPVGRQSLFRLEMENGPLPKTRTVSSGRDEGSFHLYFKYPEEGPVYSRPLKGYPGIDIKADGAYVVAPPSLHASGRRYMVMLSGVQR